jgi:hypothetical protein
MGARVFPEIKQARKEDKYGYIEGLIRRHRMYLEIIRANLSLKRYAEL